MKWDPKTISHFLQNAQKLLHPTVEQGGTHP